MKKTIPKSLLKRVLPVSGIAFVLIVLIGSGIIGINDGNILASEQSEQKIYPGPARSSGEMAAIPEVAMDDPNTGQMPLYGEWKVFTTEDGLPSNKINTVKIDEDRILVGTDRGLAVFEDNVWTVYTQDDGLAHRNVLSIDVDELTGDVWIGTMSGLNRWSAGLFERFDQFNSGLANDVVYEAHVNDRYVWVATAAGANRYDTYQKQWKIFNEETSPLHEPWTYGITTGKNKAYIAAWGGGVVEYNNETDRFRVYRDPDGQFQLSLFPDDGLVHDITTGVAFDNDILWVSTYFGLSRYDGQSWKGYLDHDTGLTSGFINAIKAKNSIAYIATDDGLNTFDGTTWVTYNTGTESGEGITTISNIEKEKKLTTDSSISHGFIWNMDIDDEMIWVATSYGLSRAKIVGYVDNSIL